MKNIENWDWTTGKKVVADISGWQSEYESVEEPYVSPDGEQIAAIVQIEEETVSVCVNGTPWEKSFDKIWYLRFSPDNQAVAIVSDTAEWSVAVDGKPWENWFEFVWNTRFSQEDGSIAIAAQNARSYFAVKDDVPWETGFSAMSNLTLSRNGRVAAAAVQTEALKEGDIFEFQKGHFTIAADGTPWKNTFLNAWEIDISADNRLVAAEVRLSLYDYTIAINDEVWPNAFSAIWRPRFNPVDNSVTAPVKVPGGWSLAKDGELFWEGRYVQLWQHFYSTDGKKIAGIAAPVFGKWTIVENDIPWNVTFNEVLTDPVYSPDNRSIACTGKNDGKWYVAVDGKMWPEAYDRAWPPVFSPQGDFVAAKVERNGKYAIAVNGKTLDIPLAEAWNPVFSPDNTKIMVKGIGTGEDEGKYCRHIIETDKLPGK